MKHIESTPCNSG